MTSPSTQQLRVVGSSSETQAMVSIKTFVCFVSGRRRETWTMQPHTNSKLRPCRIFLGRIYRFLYRFLRLWSNPSFHYPYKGGPKVYDVTKYLDDHPGGAEVMLDVAGQNADEFFEDIGHSKEARNELAKYLIGTYKLTAEELAKMKADAEKKAAQGGSSSMMMLVVVALIAIYIAYTQVNR